MYLWNAAARCNAGSCAHAAGGQAFQMVAMPSLAACEAVGSAAKQMIDQYRPDPTGIRAWSQVFESPPTVFRCVEIAK